MGVLRAFSARASYLFFSRAALIYMLIFGAMTGMLCLKVKVLYICMRDRVLFIQD